MAVNVVLVLILIVLSLFCSVQIAILAKLQSNPDGALPRPDSPPPILNDINIEGREYSSADYRNNPYCRGRTQSD